MLKRYPLSPFEKAKLKKLNAEAGIAEAQYKSLIEDDIPENRTVIVDDLKESDTNANSETKPTD